jgi:oligopeptide transport system ATP-binding protein
MNSPVLEVRGLTVHFPVAAGGLFSRKSLVLRAVQDVSFELQKGESLGIVGESGCGKSTLARAVLGLQRATSGAVIWKGADLTRARAEEMREFRRRFQIVFQDPRGSLDPRMTIGQVIAEPLRAFRKEESRAEHEQRVRNIMREVGLSPELFNRYPHEISGGQCQRAGIARAMILEPELVVCDEAVSALDVSVQAQIINLLMDLRSGFHMSMIFISHDLSVVHYVCDRVMVLYLGRVMEICSREKLLDGAAHPYTQALLAAIPESASAKPRQQRTRLGDDTPNPLSPPSGCVFHPRCPLASEQCRVDAPAVVDRGDGHQVACHNV